MIRFVRSRPRAVNLLLKGMHASGVLRILGLTEFGSA